MFSCYALRLGQCAHWNTRSPWLGLNHPESNSNFWCKWNRWGLEGCRRTTSKLETDFFPFLPLFLHAAWMLGTLNLLCSHSSKASHIRKTSWQLPISIRNPKRVSRDRSQDRWKMQRRSSVLQDNSRHHGSDIYHGQKFCGLLSVNDLSTKICNWCSSDSAKPLQLQLQLLSIHKTHYDTLYVCVKPGTGRGNCGEGWGITPGAKCNGTAWTAITVPSAACRSRAGSAGGPGTWWVGWVAAGLLLDWWRMNAKHEATVLKAAQILPIVSKILKASGSMRSMSPQVSSTSSTIPSISRSTKAMFANDQRQIWMRFQTQL